MNNLEQINSNFFKAVAEFQILSQKIKLSEQYFATPLMNMAENNLKELYNLREFASSCTILKEKEDEIKKEWDKLCKSRTFYYKQLENIIVMAFTRMKGKQYYSATRLVKHSFQIDEEKRPFYQAVSFITPNKEDLEFLILDELSDNMIPIYKSQSLFIKPLEQELNSKESFDYMMQLEMEEREIDCVYVSTKHDISECLDLKKPPVYTIISNAYLNLILEGLIALRYQKDDITNEEIYDLIDKYNSEKIKVYS